MCLCQHVAFFKWRIDEINSVSRNYKILDFIASQKRFKYYNFVSIGLEFILSVAQGINFYVESIYYVSLHLTLGRSHTIIVLTYFTISFILFFLEQFQILFLIMDRLNM